jgi:hypothetical protein
MGRKESRRKLGRHEDTYSKPIRQHTSVVCKCVSLMLMNKIGSSCSVSVVSPHVYEREYVCNFCQLLSPINYQHHHHHHLRVHVRIMGVFKFRLLSLLFGHGESVCSFSLSRLLSSMAFPWMSELTNNDHTMDQYITTTTELN